MFKKSNFYFNKKSNFYSNNKHSLFKKIKKQTITDLFFSEKKFFIEISHNQNSLKKKNNFFLYCYSNSKVFKNLEWYERELNEMSNKVINNIYDSRSLLLMYSTFLNKHERNYIEDKG